MLGIIFRFLIRNFNLKLITEDEEWANYSDDGNEDEDEGEGADEEEQGIDLSFLQRGKLYCCKLYIVLIKIYVLNFFLQITNIKYVERIKKICFSNQYILTICLTVTKLNLVQWFPQE